VSDFGRFWLVREYDLGFLNDFKELGQLMSGTLRIGTRVRFGEYMDKKVEWFQKNCKDLVSTMQNCSHHYDENHLNPYHLEGDIWTHTMMGCNLGEECEIWQWSALFHDIGKPACAFWNHEKKRKGFYGHEGVSAFMVFDILKKYGLNKNMALEIFRIVNLHTEPFKLTQEKFLERMTNNNILFKSVLALNNADQRGRFNHNGEAVVFNNTPNRLGLCPYDKEVTIMVGLPASGKSTYVSKLEDYHVISRDALVLEHGKGDDYSEKFKNVDQKEIDKLLQKEYQYSKKYDKVVVDMTHMSRKSRRKSLSHYNGFKKKAVVCLAPLDVIYYRNKQRVGKYIPNEVYLRMMKSFYLPLYDEFDEIEYKLEEYESSN